MPEKDASETHLQRAILAVQSGRLEEARRLLASILRQDPGNAAAWVWLGKAVDDPEKRRECFSRALRADPNNEEARLGLVALLSGPQAVRPRPASLPCASPPTPFAAPTALRPCVTMSPSGRCVAQIAAHSKKFPKDRWPNSG